MPCQSVSAIIVTFNSARSLADCLMALTSEGEGIISEIIVVDNASNDDTCAIAAKFPAARLMRNHQNKGFAAGVNSGLLNASSEYNLVLNPDVTISRHAIVALRSALKDENRFAAVGCRMVYPDGNAQISCRRFPTVTSFLWRVVSTNSLTARFLSRKVAPFPRQDGEPSGSIVSVDWILGGCMMVRRDALADIGLLDERYFLYYEDIDWCYRAHLNGWDVGFTTAAVVVHQYQRSSSALLFSNRLMWIHLRSAARFFGKFAKTRGIHAIV
jgi:GT2 family glycosyltransferase